MDQSKPAPSYADVSAAQRVLGSYQLHFYQLLYFQRPALTQPGHPGYPFDINFHPEHRSCLKVQYNGRGVDKTPEWFFMVTPMGLDKITETDAMVLEKCGLIMEEAKNPKAKVSTRACCSLAVIRNCVCTISFFCPLHGNKCIGTHD